MGNRNCDVEHFLDLGLKRPRRHHLFDTLPGSAKCLRVVRERAPEVADEIGLPRPANVVEDDARLGGEFIVGKQLRVAMASLAGSGSCGQSNTPRTSPCTP